MDINDVTIVRLPSIYRHWESLLGLIKDSFAFMDGVIDPPSSAVRLTANGLAEKAHKEACFVALAGGQIIGCLFAAAHQNSVYIGKVAIIPPWRRHGVAAALMNAAEDFAVGHGRQLLEIQIRVELTGNQVAFAHMGFQEVERTAHPGYARPTSITMRKTLGQTGPS